MNPKDGTVYAIAKPDKPPFAGHEVEVTGTLQKKQLAISDIKLAD